MPKQFVIEQSYHLAAPPTKVFQALTDPKILVKWFLTKAKFDPRDGGDYFFEWMVGYNLKGKVKHIERDKAVSYSFGSDTSTVSFEVARKGNGTLLRLRNDGIEDVESLESMAGHWGYYLTNLKSVLDHGIDLRSKNDWK